MALTSAIEAFNKARNPKIKVQTSRDGRVTASLPRVRREILAQGSPLNAEVEVTASDIAWLCEEARRAAAPALALLEAALGALSELESVESRDVV